ncbi:diguanylate cyclase [Brevibacillus sp. SYSU BS000544]|uniref:diguanylate cyclase n=1 Tax=Brevibacillus sp. SYSU BS000544 TaxID=3416443 RepID=UPI003CE52B18
MVQRDIMSAFKIRSIKQQLRFRVSFLIILIGLLIFIPIILIERNHHQEESMKRLEEATKYQKMYVEKWIQQRSAEVAIIASMPATVLLEKERMLANFDSFVKKQSEFDSLVYINKDGFTEVDTNSPPGISLSDRDYFLEAKKGNSFITDVLIGRASGKPRIIFSSPVFTPDKQFNGVVFGAVDLTTINRLMKNFTIGNSGETYIVNREGIMLTESRFTQELISKGQIPDTAKLNYQIDTEIIQNALAGKHKLDGYVDYRGNQVIGTYQWTNNGKWIILAEIDQEEVEAPFRSFSLMMIFILLFTMLVGHFLMIRLSSKLTEPIQSLLDGVRNLRKGNYQNIIEEHHKFGDVIELQELCQTFNQMATTIDEKIQTTQKIKNQLALIYHSVSDLISLYEIKNQSEFFCRSVNQTYLTVTRQEESQVVGKELSELLTPEKLSFTLSKFKQAVEFGSIVTYEEVVTLHRGELLVENTIHPIVDERGEVTFLLGVARDITERKKTELLLEESNQRYKSLFDHNPNVCFALDKTGNFINVNYMASEISGYQKEELLYRSSRHIIVPDDQAKALCNFTEVIEGASTYIELRIMHAAGRVVELGVTAVPIKVREQIVGAIGVAEDITEKKMADARMKEANQMLQRLSKLDGLTEIANRRHFDEVMDIEWNRCRKESKELSLIMLDIDYFKLFNDQYGHLGGDECLKRIAQSIEGALDRPNDLAARYGGEEFAVILPDTDMGSAFSIAEKIRTNIELLQISHAGSKVSDIVTISLGISTVKPEPGIESKLVIEQADFALYRAKKAGCNRVMYYEQQ